MVAVPRAEFQMARLGCESSLRPRLISVKYPGLMSLRRCAQQKGARAHSVQSKLGEPDHVRMWSLPPAN
jgi:hypothetical protein